jgi:hypothetical protein
MDNQGSKPRLDPLQWLDQRVRASAEMDARKKGIIGNKMLDCLHNRTLAVAQEPVQPLQGSPVDPDHASQGFRPGMICLDVKSEKGSPWGKLILTADLS